VNRGGKPKPNQVAPQAKPQATPAVSAPAVESEEDSEEKKTPGENTALVAALMKRQAAKIIGLVGDKLSQATRKRNKRFKEFS